MRPHQHRQWHRADLKTHRLHPTALGNACPLQARGAARTRCVLNETLAVTGARGAARALARADAPQSGHEDARDRLRPTFLVGAMAIGECVLGRKLRENIFANKKEHPIKTHFTSADLRASLGRDERCVAECGRTARTDRMTECVQTGRVRMPDAAPKWLLAVGTVRNGCGGAAHHSGLCGAHSHCQHGFGITCSSVDRQEGLIKRACVTEGGDAVALPPPLLSSCCQADANPAAVEMRVCGRATGLLSTCVARGVRGCSRPPIYMNTYNLLLILFTLAAGHGHMRERTVTLGATPNNNM